MLLPRDKQPGMLRIFRSCLLGNVRQDIGRSYWSRGPCAPHALPLSLIGKLTETVCWHVEKEHAAEIVA